MKKLWMILLLGPIVYLVILFANIAYIPQYEPDEGIWFCEELQIQLDYNGGNETFIEEGEMLHCGCGSDRGVNEIQVSCEQRNHPTYELGELVFRAEIKQLTDKKMTVFKLTTGEEYIFVRIDI